MESKYKVEQEFKKIVSIPGQLTKNSFHINIQSQALKKIIKTVLNDHCGSVCTGLSVRRLGDVVRSATSRMTSLTHTHII